MNQQESSLNERILQCLDNNLCVEGKVKPFINGTGSASKAIERLVLQEKIDLLTSIQSSNILVEFPYILVTDKITELQNQLKQL